MKTSRWLFTAGVLAAGLWAGACNDGTTKPSHVHATATVALSQSTLTLKTGEQAVLTAQPTCSCGQVLESPVTWTSSDGAVATVANGTVTAVSFGTATITAAADGKSGTAALTVEPLGTVITSTGGTVTSSDGLAVLEVPAEALTTATDIAVLPVADSAFHGDQLLLSGTGYEVRPAALALSKAATLRVSYDPTKLPTGTFQEQLRLRERDRVQNQWMLDLANQQLDSANHKVGGETQHGGTFALVVNPPVGTLIGPDGGTVLSTDGNFSLSIPAGALDVVTDIQVTAVADMAFGNDTTYVSGTGYMVSPSDVVFKNDKSASMNIKYDAGKIPTYMDPQTLDVGKYDAQGSGNKWQGQDHTGNANNVVSANVKGLGTYGVTGKARTPSKLTISPATIVDVEKGDVVAMSAAVEDASGVSLNVPVEWTVSDENIASVASTGNLTADLTGKGTGSVTVSASAGNARGQATGGISARVGSVEITPSSATTGVGGTVDFTAVAKDVDGNVLNEMVTWSTGATTVGNVTSTGATTARGFGVAEGSTTITGRLRKVSGSATLTVRPIATITISKASSGGEGGGSGSGSGGGGGGGGGSGSRQFTVAAGSTVQLVATAMTSDGQVVSTTFRWSSSNESIASVDRNGLVTGVVSGTASITASVGTVSGSANVRVTGEGETTTGNNISWPIIFGEGVPSTMTIRPASTETAPYAEFQTATATDPTAAFFYSGNTKDATYSAYYVQGTTSTWRAQVVDGTGQSKYALDAAWGDNLAGTESGGGEDGSGSGGSGGTSGGSLTVGHPIRIEVALSATGVGTLTGYNMTVLANASSPDEIQGTDGTQGAFVPLFYTSDFTFSIQEAGAGGGGGGGGNTITLDKPMAAETNVGGRLVYGAQFTPTVAGDYTLTFTLGGSANGTITSSTNGVVDSGTQSSITITVKEAAGGQ